MNDRHDSAELGGLPKLNSNKIQAQTITLSSALRWWMKVCVIIGLPLNKKSYGLGTKLLITTILVTDFALGLTDVINASQVFQHSKVYTKWYRISYTISHYNSFISFAILHGVLLWKLRNLGAVFQEMNQEIHIDSKLGKILQISVLVLLFYTSATQCSTYVTAYRANSFVFDWPDVVRRVYWLMLSSFCIFPVIFGYTITLLIFPLGYQFALLREAIEKESFLSLRKIYERYIKLCKLTEKLQECLCVPLLVFFGSTLVSLCLTALFLVDQLSHRNYSVIAWMTFFAVERGMRCICICFSADYLKDQVNSVALQIAETEIKHRHLPHTRDIARGFAISICNLEQLTTLTVGGFCELNKPLLLAMFAFVVSYLVVLWQIRSADSDYIIYLAPIDIYSNISTTAL